jgi:recombination protein RecA
MYDRGISRESDLLKLGLNAKILEKSGNYVNYGEIRLGLGEKKAKEFLREHPELMDEISQKILSKHGLLSAAMEVPPEGDEATEPAEPFPEPAVEKPTKGGRKGRGAAAATPAETEE